MIVKYDDKIRMEPVQMDGVRKVRKAVLIGQEEGAPNFFMRKFDLEAGGHTPHHSHDWEHVVFVLSGSGTLKGVGGEYELKPGASVFVAPNEEHQFIADRESGLSFLCTVPKEGE
jgi:quercetin dioxygenase-like cupin family protein